MGHIHQNDVALDFYGGEDLLFLGQELVHLHLHHIELLAPDQQLRLLRTKSYGSFLAGSIPLFDVEERLLPEEQVQIQIRLEDQLHNLKEFVFDVSGFLHVEPVVCVEVPAHQLAHLKAVELAELVPKEYLQDGHPVLNPRNQLLVELPPLILKVVHKQVVAGVEVVAGLDELVEFLDSEGLQLHADIHQSHEAQATHLHLLSLLQDHLFLLLDIIQEERILLHPGRPQQGSAGSRLWRGRRGFMDALDEGEEDLLEHQKHRVEALLDSHRQKRPLLHHLPELEYIVLEIGVANLVHEHVEGLEELVVETFEFLA